MNELYSKYEKLKERLCSLGSVAVAYSAGVDSTFLLKTAHDLLGDRAAAITVRHSAFPQREQNEADEFCRAEKIRHIEIYFDETSVRGFTDNPPDRCYICKKAIFGEIIAKAAELGVSNVADGSNVDDKSDDRPGMRALAELGVLSPLREAGLGKRDVRVLSKEIGLNTWDKPSYACLATRIPHGEKITPEKLSMIERAEDALFELGFRQSRVRYHGDVARIEIESGDFKKMLDPALREKIVDSFREIGFTYTALDLAGYRTDGAERVV